MALQGLVETGKILQVLQTVKTDTFTSAVDETFTDITGLSVAITPSSALNKILVNVTLASGFRPGANAIMFRLVRDATEIAIGDADGNRNRTTFGDAIVSNDSITNASITFLDSPSTTSATTYKVQFWQDSPGSAIFVNRSVTDSDIASHQRTISQITVMEIAG